MKKLFIVFAMLGITGLPTVQAARIAIFDDPFYVDTGAGSPVSSSDALQALLVAQGNTVSTFTGSAAGDFTAAGADADLILFPMLLNYGRLAADLTPEAGTALADYVAAGGSLITTGGDGQRLLDAALYTRFASTGTGGPSQLDATAATGTLFATGPASLASPPQPDGAINPYAFFPSDGLELYHDGFGGVTVMAAPYGSGHYGFLAWGYGDATPLGTLDGGWNEVLGKMVQYVVPEPSSLFLVAGGIGGLLVSSRRRLHL